MNLIRLLPIFRKWTRVRPKPRPRQSPTTQGRPIGIARGGAPLIIGVGLCLVLAGANASSRAAAPGDDPVWGEVLVVRADGAQLTLLLPSGDTMLVAVAPATVITLNGRVVDAQALRPVTAGSFVDAAVRFGPAGDVQSVDGRYRCLEGIVADLEEPKGWIKVRTLDAFGRGELRDLPLAADLTVNAGGARTGLKAVRRGSPVLVLLNWAGEVKKIELPPA